VGKFIALPKISVGKQRTQLLLVLVAMLKRMTSKLHIGKPAQHGALSVAASPSPVKSSQKPSAMSTGRLDYRGSLSTERTSQSSKHDDTSFDNTALGSPPLVRRPRGHYKLCDFVIERTLGTGSFGRVHLGASTFDRAKSHA
jgi:hypothetical protein